MGSVDNRIVHMEFDNALFEKGVSQTIQTLNKLDNGLNTLNNTHALDNLQDAATAITKKFSIMGTIGDEITRRLANDIIDITKKITVGPINAAFSQIKTGGIKRSFNIENAHFQLQGLLKDEEKVQAVMQNANDSVDGTAYGYDEAAKAASQFAASGIEAGEEMESALRAITGVAAMTNSEYESISQIFTTVAGNGRMMGDQLLQLSSRGLNAAASLADFVNGVNDGSIEVSDNVKAVVNQFDEAIKNYTDDTKFTEQDIRTGVSKGIVSFKLFSDAMDSTFGDHAKQANATFNGAFANMKAALSRIGQDFIMPLIAQNGPIVQLFNAVRVKINDARTGLKGISSWFTNWASTVVNWATNLVNSIDVTGIFNVVNSHFNSFLNILSAIGKILTPIGKAFQEVFFKNVTLDKFAASMQKVADAGNNATENFKKFWTESKEGKRYLKEIQLIFEGLFSVIKIVGKTIGNILYILSPLLILVKDLFKWLTDLLSPLGLGLKKAGEAYDKAKGLTKVVNALHDAISKLVDIIEAVINPLFDFIGTLSSTKDIKKAWAAVKADIKPFTDFLQNAFLKAGVAIGNAFIKINEKIEELARKYPIVGKLVDIFDKLKNILEKIGIILGGAIYQAFTSISSQMPNFVSSIKEAFNKVSSYMSQIGFIGTIQKIFAKIDEEINALAAKNKFVYGLVKVADTIKNAFSNFGTFLKDIGVFDTLSKAVNKLADLISKLLDKIDTKLSGFYNKHVKTKEISDAVSKAGISIRNSFKGITKDTNSVTKAGTALKDGLKSVTKDTGEFKTVTVEAAKSYSAASADINKVSVAYAKNADSADNATQSTNSLLLIVKSLITDTMLFIAYLKHQDFLKMLGNGSGIFGIIFGNGLNNIGNSIAGIGKNISGFLGQLQSAVKTWQKNETAKILKSIATSILMLAGAIAILTNLDWSSGKPQLAVGVIAGLILELAGMTKVLADSGIMKLSNEKGKIETAFSNVSQIGTTMIKMAFSLLLIAFAVSKLTKYSWKQLLPAAAVIAGLVFVLTKMTEQLAKLATVTDESEKDSDILNSISKLFLAFGVSMRVIASAVNVVAKAVAGNPSAAWQSLGILSIMLGELLVAVTAISWFNKKYKDGSKESDSDAMNAAAKTLVMAALALQMVAVPIAALSWIPWKKLLKSVIILGGMLGIMTLCLKFIGSFNKSIAKLNGASADKSGNVTAKNAKSIMRQAVNLLTVGGALMMMSAAIQMIAVPLAALAIIPFDKLLNGLKALIIMLGAMTGALIAIDAVNNALSQTTVAEAGTNILAAGGALVMVALAVQMIAVPLAALALIKFDYLKRGLAAMIIMLAAMAGALIAITAVNDKLTSFDSAQAGTNIIAAGGAILAVALALQMLIPSLQILSLFKWPSIVKGLVTMGVMLAEITAALVILQIKGDPTKGAIAIVAVAAAMQMLIVPLSILAAMPLPLLIKGLLGMASAIGIIVAALEIAGHSIPIIMPAMSAIVITADGLAAALFLAAASTVMLAKGIAALTLVAAAAPKAFSVLQDGIVAIGAGIAMIIPKIIAAIVKGFGDQTETITKNTFDFIINMLDMLNQYLPQIVDKACTLIINVFTLLKGRIADIVTAVVGFFQVLFAAITEATGLTGADIFWNLLASIAAIATLMAAVAALQLIAKEAFKGALELGVFIGILTGIFIGLGALSKIPGFGWLMGEGANVLLQVGNVLTQVGITFGVAFAACAALSLISAEAIAGVVEMGIFVAALTGVIAAFGAVSQIPGFTWLVTEGGNALQLVGTAIGQFVGGIVGGFAEGVSSIFPQIATDLSNFMTNLQPFIDGAQQIDPSMLDGVNALVKTILLITAAEIIQGITSFLTGGNDLASFGSQIAELGTYFSQFAKNVSGLDESTVDKANICAKSIKTLAEAADAIPNSGGLAGLFAGNNDIDDFGKQLKSFGKAFVGFSNTISGIDASVVQNAKIVADSAKIIADMAKDIPNSGGMVSWFTGNNDLDVFGNQLRSFGLAFYSFAQVIANIDPNVTTNAQSVADAAKIMSDMAKDIPNSGGLVSLFTGDNDLGTFGENLQTFGNAFAAFGNSVSAIDSSAIESATNEFGKIIGLANLASAADTSGFDKFKEAFEKLGTDSINNFVNTFDGASEKVKTAIDKLISTAQNELKSGTSGILMTGTSFGRSFINWYN